MPLRPARHQKLTVGDSTVVGSSLKVEEIKEVLALLQKRVLKVSSHRQTALGAYVG